MPNKDKITQKNGSQKTNRNIKDKNMNGNMVNNLEEVKRLGKEMEGMSTNKELEKEGLAADPEQETSRLR